ncbi:ATP-binding protein [Stappia sp.]|uniref:sensor histidine kinase n=1 Tax=Stappia sp. TaxID=1870903 RepID=UPI0032D922D3
MARLSKWIASRSVFSLLVITTVASTLVLSFVLVLALQRVADEHPRRYLARAVFHTLVDLSAEMGGQPVSVNGVTLVQMSRADAEVSEFRELFRMAMDDPDGIAISPHNDYYAAGGIDGDRFIVLPRFGASISTFALFLVGVVISAIIGVILLIYYLMRRLTHPFVVLSDGIARVEEGDLSYQIPLDRTFGEFRNFAIGFNTMVAELQRIHEARRHMLLALPHELLTPLSRLKVRKDLVEDASLRDKINKDIAIVEEILASILATERRHSNEDSSEIVEIVPFAHQQIALQIDDRKNIRVENATGFEYAFFDPFVVSVLIKNFVSNAVRYGDGNPIAVRFEVDREDPAALCISVEDQGIGIAEDQLKYLTEPFWRVDESRGRASGGYGLGLYLCRKITEGLGGRMIIQSKLGEGTTILAIIPNAICRKIEDMANDTSDPFGNVVP